ncbi:MAG: hypothetical protein J6U85_00380 [Bacteroidales bacterium]|nr:hypothetical protein [Bacteroidales bacterium]
MDYFIDFWDEKTKEAKRNNCMIGKNAITYHLQNNDMYNRKDNSFIVNLSSLLSMTKGSANSFYITLIPPSDNIVIRLRLSNHPSSPSEWCKHELNGVPNIRYSIWVDYFDGEDKLKLKKEPLKYIENNVLVVEYAYNKRFLNTINFKKDFFNTLLNIYSLTKLPESKQVIKLKEEEFYEIIKESVNIILESIYRNNQAANLNSFTAL